MSIFDNLIQIDSDGNIFLNQWVEWDHISIPNKPDWLRQLLRAIMFFIGHCMKCTVLDGCYFVERIMPEIPLHENCDCNKINIPYDTVKISAKAECDIRKFTEYIFKDETGSKGKNKIFYDLGFNINDSIFLQQEFCKQALNNYLVGNYKLKTLDQKGQRLAIPISLKDITFYSGWIMYPEGLIKNTTPFGGWIK